MTTRHERGGAPSSTRLPPAARIAVLLLGIVPLAVAPGVAQHAGTSGHAEASHGPGEIAYLGVNVLVGGLTAGLWQELSGGSFREGFAGGALGGSVQYAGKRLAAESFPGGGFLGRQVASIGTSMVRNTSDARPLLDSLRLAVGPLRLHLSPRTPARPRLEANLHELYWTTYGLAEGRFALDLGKSLSSGTAVFRSDRQLLDSRDRRLRGATVGGTVFLSPLDAATSQHVLAHEMTHVLQLDFLHHAWFGRLEDHLARKLPGRGLVDRVDYDAVFIGLQSTGFALGGRDILNAPLEAEADFLGRR